METDRDRRFRCSRLALAAWATVFTLLASAAHADAPPGTLVDVGGHRMLLNCEGQRASARGATVVFDSGLGDSELVWSRVQPSVAKATQACSYDRAGYGESEARLPPRTSAVIVHELHALLARADVPPPYVLVGHSFGGWNMQLFASRYPSEVAALVLVDSSQVNQIERYEHDVGVVIAPKGDFHMNTTPFIPPNLPPAAADRAHELTYDPVTWRTAHNELVAFRTSEAQVAAAGPLPPIPIVVVSRGGRIAEGDIKAAQREKLWRLLQQEFVDAHPGAVHFIAHDSGHYIQLQQPMLVTRSICTALRQAKVNTAIDCALPIPPASLHAH